MACDTPPPGRPLNWNWRIVVKSLAAICRWVHASRGAYDVRVTLDIRATVTLCIDYPAGLLKLAYFGHYAVGAWITTARDEAGQLRIDRIDLFSEQRLLLRAQSGHSEPADLPAEAFELDVIALAVRNATEAYLAGHYVYRPLSLLMPGFDIKSRLAQQEADAAGWSWLNDVLGNNDEEDEGDWWKRGGTPPY
jgi:hypothetical protein